MQNLPFAIFSTLIKKMQLAQIERDSALINVTEKGFITLYFHRNLIVDEMKYSHGVNPNKAYKIDIDNEAKKLLIQESKDVNVGTINNFRDYGNNPDISRVTMQSNRKIDLAPGIHMMMISKLNGNMVLPFDKTFNQDQFKDLVDYVVKGKLSSVAKFVVDEPEVPEVDQKPAVKTRPRMVF